MKTAKIQWLSSELGGRKSPPNPPKYSTAAKFKDLTDVWPQEAWSVILEFDEPPDQQGINLVQIRFLSNDAPQELLYKGSTFELYEGYRRVATGEILN